MIPGRRDSRKEHYSKAEAVRRFKEMQAEGYVSTTRMTMRMTSFHWQKHILAHAHAHAELTKTHRAIYEVHGNTEAVFV